MDQIERIEQMNNSDNILVIDELKFDNILENPSIAIIGKRGMGKTSCTLGLIKYLALNKKIDECCVFSDNRSKHFYSKYINNTSTTKMSKYHNVHSKYDRNIIENIVDRQMKDKSKRVLVVIDNCLLLSEMKNDVFTKFLLNARHYNISCIITKSFPMSFTPIIRSNFTHTFLLGENSVLTQRRLYNHYCGMFPEFERFRQVFQQLTDVDYRSMVVVNGTSSSITDKILWYQIEGLDARSSFSIEYVKLDTPSIYMTAIEESDKLDIPERDYDNIREFDIDNMCDNPSICMIAQSESGKSWVIRAIMQHLFDNKKVDELCVIAPTEECNPFYYNYTDNIHYKYKSSIVQQILDKQKLDMVMGNTCKHVLIVFDDCFASCALWHNNEQALSELLFNGRHYNISFILSMQFPLKLPPAMRGNIDYVFLMKEDYVPNLKRLYDYYGGMFPTFDQFRNTFKQLAFDYQTMVIPHRVHTGTSLSDRLHWYKAPSDDKYDFFIPGIVYHTPISASPVPCVLMQSLGRVKSTCNFSDPEDSDNSDDSDDSDDSDGSNDSGDSGDTGDSGGPEEYVPTKILCRSTKKMILYGTRLNDCKINESVDTSSDFLQELLRNSEKMGPSSARWNDNENNDMMLDSISVDEFINAPPVEIMNTVNGITSEHNLKNILGSRIINQNSKLLDIISHISDQNSKLLDIVLKTMDQNTVLLNTCANK
jgi:hypothetical protein